jgi:PAS domain S-box-containing protein
MGTQTRLALPTLGLLAGLGIVGVVAAISYRHLSSLDESARWVSHTHEVIETADTMLLAVEDAVGARRAYSLSSDEAALGPYEGALARVASTRAALRRLTSDNPGQQRRLDELEPALDARVAQLKEAIRQRRELGPDTEREAALTTAGDALSRQLKALIGQLKDEERRLVQERQATFHVDSEAVKRTIVVGFTVSALILLVAFLLLRREVARRARSEEALAEREHRLSILLDSIGDGVIATNAAAMVTHLNPVAAELTGWSAADAVGKPFSEVFRIIDENTRAPQADPVARVLAERVRIGLANHTALISRDGVERLIADSAAPILDAQGRVQGAVLVFRDVSATRAIEERFRKLVAAAPDATVIVGAGGRIAITNDQTTALFGYSSDELVGQPVEMLVPERFRDQHGEHRRQFNADPKVREMGAGRQLVARRKDGTEIPIEVSLSPLETPEGTQVIAAIRDITRRRDLERFRDEYVGYISHDLKNPLSIIVLQARLLARLFESHASKDEKQALRIIADNAAYIDRMVRELLEMAYVESDHIQIHPDPVALVPFLQSLLERTLSTSDRARVRLDVQQPSTVSAERNRIERVVVNFVQNALKYAPSNSPVRVRLEASDNHAMVSVTDEGPGISPAEQKFVFEKYRRADSARSKEGLGLGLYISKKIIEAHGGEIGVESTPGRGATFFFRLPKIADLPVAAPTSITPATSQGNRLQGLRVLIVDDERNAVSALVTLLGDEGLEVMGATSGEEALKLAEAKAPEVAVLDVQMPGMSGLTLLERLRERYPGLPAVIMTGHMQEQAAIVEARESKGAAYVGKPVDVDELLRTLNRLLPLRG